MVDTCIICKIINKTLPSYIVFENKLFIAFLDIKPLFIGHVLLSPKKHYPTLYDLPEREGNILLKSMQVIGQAITQVTNSQGTFIANNNIVSQSIAHLHIHIVPRNKGDGLKGFFWPRTRYQNEEELVKMQLNIKNALLNMNDLDE